MPRKTEPVRQERALGGTLEFMQAIWAFFHALQTRSAAMERSIGLTGPQRLVLRIVGRYPGITARELAETLHIHASTLSGVVSRLANRKLLARLDDPTDKRRVRLKLTERGRSFDVPRPGTVESAIEAALQRAAPGQVRAARSLIYQITAQLESTPES
ncbi:MAG: MarR family transcriptional regulator [Deltaproteobacteria bacterium]|nr:MarR family transcriptional regulator [Deltaproteobacteria bacterium]